MGPHLDRNYASHVSQRRHNQENSQENSRKVEDRSNTLPTMIAIILRTPTGSDNMMHSLRADLFGQFLSMALRIVHPKIDTVVTETATSSLGLQGVVVAGEFGAGAVETLRLPVFVEGLAVGEASHGSQGGGEEGEEGDESGELHVRRHSMVCCLVVWDALND